MTVSSNLYASKVYAEHPIVSWPLDDDISYVSLITEDNRDLTTWTTDATATILDDFPGAPFPNSFISEITNCDPVPNILEMISTTIDFTAQSLDQNNVSIGMYLYTSSTINWYEFGYRRWNGSAWDEYVTRFTNAAFDTWIRLQTTVDMISDNVELIFRAEFFDTSSSDYGLIMNGLTVGQWSEPTALQSLGVRAEVMPVEIGDLMPSTWLGVPVYPYGVSDSLGYITVEYDTGQILAKNTGIPMVFGSENSTRLIASNYEDPSLVFPGHGVLNESGRYNSLTFEFWLKMEYLFEFPKRIWGPIMGRDGLYAGGDCLTLVVGNNFKSYHISEWYRPMLIDMAFTINSASLMINGEEVARLEYSVADLDLPLPQEDYVCFFMAPEMELMEIDCVSIMPYALPAQVAKRRFVWGQGVDSVENINISFLGTTALIDFPYSKYSAVKSFPDTARFDKGYSSNLSVSPTSISMPEYSLPEFHLGEKTLQQYYDDNISYMGYSPYYPVDQPYFSFRPTDGWIDPCYIKFSNLNILTDKVEAIFVSGYDAGYGGVQPLIQIRNKNTGEIIKLYIQDGELSYDMFGESSSGMLISNLNGYDFAAGFKFSDVIATYGKPAEKFFSNHAALEVLIGGDGEYTFGGDIFSVGICNKELANSTTMTVYGGVIAMRGSRIDDIVSYTLLPTWKFGTTFFDIGVRSYWEEYAPLSFFSSYTTDAFGNKVYDFDFLQFNVGASPVRSNTSSNVPLKTYVTFQRTLLGANKPFSKFTNWWDFDDYDNQIIGLLDLSLIDRTEISETKFEVIDQTVIYPPRYIPFDQQAVVVHLDFQQRGIISSPTKIRKLSLASLSMHKDMATEIGTRYSNSLYPYSRAGYYYDYKIQNPVSIYRDSTPYLYLTKNSGIRSMGSRAEGIDRGISMPVNKGQARDYKVTALQLWIKMTYPDNDSNFPHTPKVLFSLDGRIKSLNFNVVLDSSQNRVALFATDIRTRKNFSQLSYYQDGVPVVTPYLELDKWSCIGINFTESIDMDRHLGSLNMNQGAVFNNVSFYRTSYLQDTQAINYRQWIRVRQNPTPRTWIYWRGVDPGPYHTWEDMYRLPEIQGYATSPDALYSAYTGTNREVVDDNHGVVITNDGVTILTGAEWVDFNKKPV